MILMKYMSLQEKKASNIFLEYSLIYSVKKKLKSGLLKGKLEERRKGEEKNHLKKEERQGNQRWKASNPPQLMGNI